MDRFRSSLKSFESRGAYLNYISRRSSCNNYMSITDNYYYGKVNSNGDIVYLSEKYLATLPTKGQKVLYALNFVTDAVIVFKKYYLKAINSGIGRDDAWREIINPIKGWQSIHELYAQNIKGLYSIVINSYLQRQDRLGKAAPDNFDDFMSAIDLLFSKTGKNVNLSRSSFIASSAAPISTTGLVIELAPQNNSRKTSQLAAAFFTSQNYDFYLKSLKKFGFMVDINYPSRIIADIGSPAMQEYMNKYELTIDNLFYKCYYKTKDYDYDLIKVYMTQFYNNYASDYPVKQKVVKAGKVSAHQYSLETRTVSGKKVPTSSFKVVCQRTLKEVIRREAITPQQLETIYNDAYWISYYPRLINYEMDNPLDTNKIKKVVKNSQDLHKTLGIDAAKSYINGVFKVLRFPIDGKHSTTLQKSTLLTSATSSDTIGPSTTNTPSGGSSSGGGGY